MARPSPKARWCFTLNNWTENEYEAITARLRDVAKFAVVGREVGDAGTPHLQGFFNLKTKSRLAALKRWQGFERAHFEEAKGSDEDSLRYCTKKDEDAFQVGEPFRPGQRTDLEAAVAVLRESGSLKRVADECPVSFVKYHRGLEAYRNLVCPPKPRDFKSEVIVICGDAGVGKSRRAHDMATDGKLFVKPVGEWFDGWDGVTDLLLDDFHGDMKFSLFKILLDRYQCRVPIKGGFVEARPQRIFITANNTADKWYDYAKLGHDALRAVYRRFTSYKWLALVDGERVEQDIFDDNGDVVQINF